NHRRRPAACAKARGAPVKAAGNLGARSVRGAHLKRLADRGRQCSRKQPLVLALDIPDWRELRDVDAALDRARGRRLPGLADAVALELGEHEQDAKEGLADRRREIDVVGDAHEHGALALELLEDAEGSDERAREAVELGDHASPAVAASDALPAAGEGRA